ncbi:hypothetical protein CHS0354_023675 [Potamilus streckersoni]|uniref:Uncharacterized protein n=1 Tax=Potamilus streckersoni TaxID=2493646 RepID=A0AAE0VTT6_9BIVA|nr:hypothetical protein CHS0354_023675 [Potamilus streckersoni]
MKVRWTRKKAGNFINRVKYVAWRSLDCHGPRPTEWFFGIIILSNYYLEAFCHYSISSLVIAAMKCTGNRGPKGVQKAKGRKKTSTTTIYSSKTTEFTDKKADDESSDKETSLETAIFARPSNHRLDTSATGIVKLGLVQ